MKKYTNCNVDTTIGLGLNERNEWSRSEAAVYLCRLHHQLLDF